MLTGAVEAQNRQRVDLAIDLGDPLLQHVEQVERVDLITPQLADNMACGVPDQLIAHFTTLRLAPGCIHGAQLACKPFSGTVANAQAEKEICQNDDAVTCTELALNVPEVCAEGEASLRAQRSNPGPRKRLWVASSLRSSQ